MVFPTRFELISLEPESNILSIELREQKSQIYVFAPLINAFFENSGNCCYLHYENAFINLHQYQQELAYAIVERAHFGQLDLDRHLYSGVLPGIVPIKRSQNRASATHS